MAGPTRCDAVVVLGTRVLSGGRPSAALRRRTVHGAALVLAGRAERLVLTGGRPERGAEEARVMEALALEAGVPAERIVIEPEARTTFENALFTARLARAHGWRTLVVVSERYHLPRALLVFRRLGLRAVGSPAPPAPVSGRWAAVRAAELAKWPWYLWRLGVRDRAALRAAALPGEAPAPDG